MAKKQPFDFSEDDGQHGAAGTEMHALVDDLMGATASGEGGLQDGAAAREASQQAAQQTATQARSSTGQHDTPTSMLHKKGNQPR